MKLLLVLIAAAYVASDWLAAAIVSAWQNEYEDQLKQETEVEQRQDEQRRS